MTDEEKAEECAEEIYKNLDKCRTKELMIDAYKDGYLKGFAEGRKEKCLEQNKDGTIRPCEVMKDNEELKAKLPHWEGAKTSPTEHGWYLVYAYGEDQEEEPGVGMGYWDGTEWHAELDLKIHVLQWTFLPKPEL